MKRLRIGVLFGGRSTEHEVSILSAQSIIAAMNPERFEAVPLYIDKNGRWLLGGSIKRLISDDAARKYVYLPPDPTRRSLVAAADGVGSAPSLPPLDVVFPVFHGLNGEDGTIQGVLELANVPYVGAGVLGSALGLDKVYMKRAFAAAGLPIVDYISITRSQYEQDPQTFIAAVEQRIGYPCFAKFANSGSSVGTTKAHNRAELVDGLRLASSFDRKLLVERGIDARELEVSVLGNDEPQASVVGEVVPAHEFYDYEAKYLDEGSRLLIPAPIEPAMADKVRAMAVRAFQAVDAAGMARVDFFLERGSDRVVLNELNTIPGFTRISMYPKLWEASGLAYPQLIERLVDLALERFNDKQRSQTAIDSRLLPSSESGE
jgi:D-alanine-D-alanine ligase